MRGYVQRDGADLQIRVNVFLLFNAAHRNIVPHVYCGGLTIKGVEKRKQERMRSRERILEQIETTILHYYFQIEIFGMSILICMYPVPGRGVLSKMVATLALNVGLGTFV